MTEVRLEDIDPQLESQNKFNKDVENQNSLTILNSLIKNENDKNSYQINVQKPIDNNEKNNELSVLTTLSNDKFQTELNNIGNSITQKHKPPPIDISDTSSINGQNGPKTPLTPGGQLIIISSRRKKDKDRKIGHRRVDEQGQVTYKKIETSQICASIQLGIGYAVGSLASKPERDLLMQDFALVETTTFSSSGSNITPAHHYSDFKFKTYAPVAFRYFRDLFGIQPEDFLLSVVNEPMVELSNPGASGSVFYLTLDDEFIIKTVQHKEAEFLQKLLPGYYMNLNQNPRTLLPKFYGLYCYICGGKNVRVCVMNNLLPSSIKMHQKYDLKGSTYKRKANKHEQKKPSPTYKDLDFMEHHPDGLFLEAETYIALMKTINRDCRVLESFKIMDYSLLVGIHNLDLAAKEKQEKLKGKSSESIDEEDQNNFDNDGVDSNDENYKSYSYKKKMDLSRSKSINKQRLAAYSTAMESIHAEVEPIDEEDDVPPGGIPARNSKGERLLLFLGVIDILQSYRLKKKLEHTWKSMFSDGDTISVHKPGFYAQRFQDFMAKKVFTKITSLDLPEIKGSHRKFRNLVSSFMALKHSPSKKKSSGQKAIKQSNNDNSQPLNVSSIAKSQGTSSIENSQKENSSSTKFSSEKNSANIEKGLSNSLLNTPVPNRKQHPNSPVTPHHKRDSSNSPSNNLKKTELVWFSESNSSINLSGLGSSNLIEQSSTPIHSIEESIKSNVTDGASINVSSDSELS